MPHISMTLYPGRKPEDLEKMAEALRKSMMDTVGRKESDISVSLREEGPETFAETVNERLKNETLVLPSSYIHD